MPDGTEWMVAEMGMSTPGELRQLSLLGRPDVAVFTVVRPVHLEFFGTVQAIAEAKSELLAGLAPDGFIVANADDPEVTRIAKRHGARVVWYGIGARARRRRARAHIAPEPDGGVGSRFTLEAGGRSAEVRLPLHGLYNVENCAGGGGLRLGARPALDEIAAAVGGVRPAAMRGVVHRTAPAASPSSTTPTTRTPTPSPRRWRAPAALPGRRRLAVLGDMLELGPEGPRFHREAGERAAAARLLAGRRGRRAVARAGRGRRARGRGVWLPDAAAAADWAAAEVRERRRGAGQGLARDRAGPGRPAAARRYGRRAEGAH